MNPLNWTVRSCTSKTYLERLNLPIPDFQTLMRPFLEFASDGKEHSLAEARERLAQVFKLSDEEKKALLPSGKQPDLQIALHGHVSTSDKQGLWIVPSEDTFGLPIAV